MFKNVTETYVVLDLDDEMVPAKIARTVQSFIGYQYTNSLYCEYCLSDWVEIKQVCPEKADDIDCVINFMKEHNVDSFRVYFK